MELKFSALDREAAEAVMTWRYPPPYDIYDLFVPEGEADDTIRFLLDPVNAYYRSDDEHGELVAFCCLGHDAQVPGGDYTRPAVDIGLGVRPELTGRGQGHRYVAAVIDFAVKTTGTTALRVTIATFNRRAQQVWRRAGFVQTGTFARPFDNMEFVIMEKGA